MFIVTVHLHLSGDGKLGLVPFARSHVLERVEQLEILIVALVSELIARQTENDQVIAVLFLQGVQLNKIPDGRASHRRHVVDEHDFALVLGQRQVRALGGRVSGATAELLEREIVDGRGGVHAHAGAANTARARALHRDERAGRDRTLGQHGDSRLYPKTGRRRRRARGDATGEDGRRVFRTSSALARARRRDKGAGKCRRHRDGV